MLSLKPGDSIWVPVLSGSMAPLYLPGDEIRVIAVGQNDIRLIIKPGTVAVFYEAGRFFFHRILRICNRKKYVYQKGDANKEGSWVGIERIIGVIKEGRRKEGDGFYFYGDQSRGPFLLKYYLILIHRVKHIIKKGIKRCLFMN